VTSDAPVLHAELLDESELGHLLAFVERMAGIGTFVWEPGRRAAWSRGMFDLLGVDPAARVPAMETFLARVHPDDRELVRQAHLRLLSGAPTQTAVYRIALEDGTVRWVRSVTEIARGAGDTGDRLTGTLVDITAIHQAADELARANALLAETQRAAGLGTYVYDMSTRRMEWSDEMRRICGLAPDVEIDATLVERLTHPDDLERQRVWGQAVARGESMPPLSVRFLRPDGGERRLEARSRRVKLGSGRTLILGVSIDVTERVALEERLRDAAKLDAVGTLAAGVAHDFNNYLTVVELQLQALRTRGAAPGSAAGEAAVTAALEATRQCGVLTGQLLAFARKQPGATRRLELGAVVDGVLALFRRVAGPTIDVRVERAPGPVHVDGDGGQLEAAIMNLAINARDAMPGGGTLTIAIDVVELAAGDPLLHGTAPPGAYARVRVEDTGTGIAPEHLPRIFDPYFSTKPHGKGSGLGLASVYGTVRQHGGLVHVESALGRGTRFQVLLPRAAHDADTAPTAPGPAPAPRLRGSVLLVEDMAPLRNALAAILRGVGLTVHVAGDGVEALGVLAEHHVDVILSDVLMPRMGGRELARRAAELHPEVRIVLMSGYNEGDALAGATPVLLHKPFGPDDVLRVLGESLGFPPRT
jgi:PAS domain S-box-containing protein